MRVKKQWVNPGIEVVKLSLTRGIGNCAKQVNLNEGFQCEGYDEDVNMLFHDGVFTSAWNCNVKMKDGDILGNGKCYHTSAGSVFSS